MLGPNAVAVIRQWSLCEFLGKYSISTGLGENCEFDECSEIIVTEFIEHILEHLHKIVSFL